MTFTTSLVSLTLLLLFSLFNERVWAVDVVCASVGGKARFLTAPHNSCVCLSPTNQNLPGADCPTVPNGQAGCHASCGLDCYEGHGGTCYIECDPGYVLNPSGTACILMPSGVSPGKRKRDALQAEKERLKRVADEVASGLLPSNGGVFLDKDLCPIQGHLACSVPGATTKNTFECIDPLVDLGSCGGCVAEGGTGVDCSKLEGVQGVQCVKGTCKIGSCKPRFRLIRGFDGEATCIRN